MFSIHASAKEATNLSFLLFAKPLFFNPRLREGGDEIAKELGYKALVFNPRLREGGDNIVKEYDEFSEFSIHASAKEATTNFHQHILH